MEIREREERKERRERPGRHNRGDLKAEINLMKFLWHSAAGHHAVIVVTLLLQLAIGLLPAVITYYIQHIFSVGTDSILALVNTKNLVILFGVLLAYILLKEGIAVAQSYAMTDIKRSIERRYIRTLSAYDYTTVHDRMDNRDMMAITRESEMVTMLLPSIYRSFFGSPITILGFIALLIIVSPWLTLVVTLLLAVVVGCSVFLRKMIKAASRKLYERLSDIHVKFTEWLRGYKVFMLYGATGYMRDNMEGIVDDTASLSKKMTRIQCTQSIAVETLTYLVVIVFIWLLNSVDTRASIGALISFPTAILFIRDEAIKITKCYMKIAQTESAAQHLLRDTAEIKPRTDLRKWSGAIREVGFDGVSFRYSDKEASDLLHDASVSMQSPGLYLIIGPSGIGKSTCLDLLMGLRRPTAGRVVYNGEDISGFDPNSLLGRVSYVEQEPFLFEGTIIDNLSFGKPVDREVAVRLCRDLHLNHIVANEADLRKEIAVDGKDLSAGERQRLAFVRAMLKNPDVVLLDEATSNVDTAARDIMVDYMRRIAADKIVVCVSHDEYLQTKADKIISLKDAKLEYVKG